MNIWLVGCGKMAIEYFKVLSHFGVNFLVIGRGKNSASEFEKKTGCPVWIGGIEKAVGELSLPDAAIVCVNVVSLVDVTVALASVGVKRILVEKPLFLSKRDAPSLVNLRNEKSSEIYIAYNRRFYKTVKKLKDCLDEDGGATSLHFEFTERSHLINSLNVDDIVKQRWVLSNSSHVIDLAFYLVGQASEISVFRSNSLDWHASAAQFAGAGITQKGIIFSYHANWGCAGNWSIDVRSDRRRFLLKPLEVLSCEYVGSSDMEIICKETEPEFKPGLKEMLSCFLDGNVDALCSLDEQVGAIDRYMEIAGYAS